MPALLRDILTIKSHALSLSLLPTVVKIDALHHFPALPQVPVLATRSRTEEGAYTYAAAKPLQIAISKFAICPQWTLIHEVGHLLDHLALNPIRRGFGSEHDPLFDPLIDLWRRSHHVMFMHRQIGPLTRARKFAARRLLEEYLSPRELWARTYAQWIAVQLNDEALVKHVHHLRTAGLNLLGKTFPIQWEHAEFKDIMYAVESLFENARLK